MSRAMVDLSGQQFDDLHVERFVRMNAAHQAIYWCRCTCGRRKKILAANLKSGRTRSCGFSHKGREKKGP